MGKEKGEREERERREREKEGDRDGGERERATQLPALFLNHLPRFRRV